jgi:DNA-nicking Smr family endonuclease
MNEGENENGLHSVKLPIDGILDLHTFRPQDIKELLSDYLEACREKGLLQVRVIHGKGSGILRKTVHSLLCRMPGVASFRTAGEDSGGWGATLVTLEPLLSKKERKETS